MYARKVLEIDLGRGKSQEKPLNEDLRHQYLGGSALNLRLFADCCDPKVEPFSPENVIVIGVGALAASISPGSGKLAGITKFPLPASREGKCYVASGISGSNRFSTNLRAAGYDHLIIRGQSKRPVYLLIEDERAEICDASGLWGNKDVYETTDELRSTYPGCGVMCIGEAGEREVSFALAITDRHSSMGRNGFGAVMGSKNLKAIVVKGSQRLRPQDPDAFSKTVEEIRAEGKKNRYAQDFPELGIHAAWDTLGILLNPGVWAKAEWDTLYGPEVVRKVRSGATACSGCFLACKTDFEVKEGKRRGQRMETGHFMDIACLAQFLGIPDWSAMAYLMDICNRAGLCGISGMVAAHVLAMGRDLGLVKEEDTAGVDFSEDVEKYAELLRLIYQRRGAGIAAAGGWYSLSDYLQGTDLSGFFGMVKGAFCHYDMRDTKLDTRSFHMIVNPRGGHHPQCHWTMSAPQMPYEKLQADFLRTGATPEDADRVFQNGKVRVGRLTRHIEDVGMVMDSIGACVLYSMIGLPVHLDVLARLYTAATGKETSASQLKGSGERGHNLIKLINVEIGFTREDDQLPSLWLQPKITPEGEIRLTDYYGKKELGVEDLERELTEYYEERGWNPADSRPTLEKTAQLGLSEIGTNWQTST